jgi:DNA-directed RNA polymerase specialized sigma24 family protein
MTPDEILDKLFLVERTAKRFPDEDAARLRREKRDKAIRAAVADGMSYREIAAAIGLSHSRVAQIAGGK